MSPREEATPPREAVGMCSPSDDPFHLTEEWLRRAREQIEEDPQEARKNIETLRQLIRGDKNLKSIREDDIFLAGFLRARKHNVEKAFKMMKQYHDMRKNYPKYFQSILPSKMKFVYDAHTHAVLPQRDSLGRAVLLVKAGNGLC
ncbi:hypothetical protein WDU94_008436 [Cyamophila willieti]